MIEAQNLANYLNDPRLNLVTIVTPQDQVIVQLDKYIAHRYPAQLHRASSVWMVDDAGRLLFQRRSEQKIIGAGWWNNTVCGNVWPEEGYEACARRRLSVEIGIPIEAVAKLELQEVTKFHYKSYANDQYGEHEIDQLYVVKVRVDELSLNLRPDEVSDVMWVDIAEFFAELDRVLLEFTRQSGRPYPVCTQTVAMTFDELKRWTPPLEMQLLDEPRTVVPWAILMAQLPELRQALGISQ